MNIWANMQLRSKLLTCFLGLSLLTGVTGFVGVMTSNTIGDDAEHLSANLTPLGEAAMGIKFTATEAHLIFEEIMAGDETEDIKQVFGLLEKRSPT